MSLISKRIRTGAIVLDIVRPGWYNEISRKTLDINEDDVCILGQLYGHFDTGAAILNLDPYSGAESSAVNPRDLGFYPDALNAVSAEALTQAWRRLIKDRRAAAA